MTLTAAGAPPTSALSHPVVDLIRARAESGSTPGAREDQHRLALAIEGGAMRGVVSAGMTAALEQLGLLNVFDAIYGSSAGAINGAYFIAGRAALCASSYYEEMTTRGFIDWLRFLRGRPILSLDFVLDDVAEHAKPLDWEAVLRSPIELHPIAASARTLEAIDLGGARTKEELKEALRASSQVPLLAGPPLARGDDLLLDASLFASIPFQFAIDGGSTHVLVLRTRGPGVLRGAPSHLERMLVARRLRRVAPGLSDAFLRRAARYKEEVEELARLTESPEAEPYIFAIAPESAHVRQADRDRARVRAGAGAGMAAVYRILTGETPYVAEVLKAYPPLP